MVLKRRFLHSQTEFQARKCILFVTIVVIFYEKCFWYKIYMVYITAIMPCFALQSQLLIVLVTLIHYGIWVGHNLCNVTSTPPPLPCTASDKDRASQITLITLGKKPLGIWLEPRVRTNTANQIPVLDTVWQTGYHTALDLESGQQWWILMTKFHFPNVWQWVLW